MLQFEFDIRNHKIKNNKSKTTQLLLSFVFLLGSILIFAYKTEVHLVSFLTSISVLLLVAALYFAGLALGCKLLYPKEYFVINNRKLTYKTGWNTKETKVYLKDIYNIQMENEFLLIERKDKEELRVNLSNFSENAKSILKSYLNI